MFVDFNILNQLGSPSINSNTFANRPAAGQTGRLFVSTDTFEIYRDNGTGWDLIGGPGSSTITGTGTAGTIPLWTGTNTIGDSDLRQLASEALILNSATNDWPTTQLSNEAGRILLTSATNNPTLICWSKSAFGSGDEQGSIVLGAVTALGSTTIGGGFIDGFIENGTDGAGSLQFRTTNTIGNTPTALTINSSQVSTFTNNVIVNSPGNIGIQTATPSGLIHADGGASAARIILDADTGVARIFSFRTDNLPRWALRVDGTETGSNAGADFSLRAYDDTGAFTFAPMSVTRATGKTSWQAQQTYTTGLARGNYFDYNLSVSAGGTFSSPNAITALGASLDLTLAGSATIPSGARSGLDAYNSIGFTGTGTLTHTQGTQIRAYSNLTAGWAFNGSATGTITHLAGLRALFPDNTGSAVTVTNNYALLLNDQTANTGTVTYTNRWGVYQEGASDLNYMAANLLLGSTTNSGEKLQVTGTGKITNSTSGQTLSVIGNGNSNTTIVVSNNDTNNSAGCGFTSASDVAVGDIIVTSSTNTTAALGGRANALAIRTNSAATGGIALLATNGPSGIITFHTSSNTERARFSINGNLLLGTTTDAGQKLQVNGTTQSTQFHNVTGSLNIANNTATTVYTPTDVRGLYIFALFLPAGDSAPANYTAYAIIAWDSSAARILQQTDGANLFITLSGNNIQARQNSGSPQDVTWRVIKIG